MENQTSAKKVVVNSLIYSVSGIMLKCFSFFLLPLYTAYLTTADYGITSLASSFTGFMAFVVALSLYSAVMRFYVDYKRDAEKLRRFYGSVCVFAFLSGVLWIGIFTLLRQWTSQTLFSGTPFFPIILVCLLELLFTVQQTIFDNILRSQQRAFLSSILTIVLFLGRLALNITFVVGLKMGALGTLLASAIANFLFSVCFFFYLMRTKQIFLCLDWGILRDALRYSVPILPHNLSTHIAALVSKILISSAASLGQLGVYSVASQFGVVSDTIQTYISNAFDPWLFEKLKEHRSDFRQSIRSVVKMLIAVIGLLFVGIALFSQDYILLFVAEAYHGAWVYVPLIVLVYSIKTAYYFYLSVLLYYKKASRLLFTATLTGSLVNVALSAVLVPLWSVYGSIAADAISVLIRIAIIVVIAGRFDDVGLRIRDFILNFSIIAVFILAGLLPSYLSNIQSFSLLNFGYKLLLTVLYMALVFVMHRRELLRLGRQLFLRRRKKGGNPE